MRLTPAPLKTPIEKSIAHPDWQRWFSSLELILGGGGIFANPSTQIGLTAVNGSAFSAMRSDAAPALSQAIVPTWTGIHTWAAASDITQTVFKGNASQTVPISKWKDSAGNTLADVGYNGRVYTAENFLANDTFGLISGIAPSACSPGLTFEYGPPFTSGQWGFLGGGLSFGSEISANSSGSNLTAYAYKAIPNLASLHVEIVFDVKYNGSSAVGGYTLLNGIGIAGNTLDTSIDPTSQLSVSQPRGGAVYRALSCFSSKLGAFINGAGANLYDSGCVLNVAQLYADNVITLDVSTDQGSNTYFVTARIQVPDAGIDQTYVFNSVSNKIDNSGSGTNGFLCISGPYDLATDNIFSVTSMVVVGHGLPDSCDTGIETKLITRQDRDLWIGDDVSWSSVQYRAPSGSSHEFNIDGTPYAIIGSDGNLTLSNLAGTGERLIVSSAAGLLKNAGTIAGAYTWSGVQTFSAQPILSTLTASLPVFTDASKGLVSVSIITVANGGTGAATLASNGVLYGNGTSAVHVLAVNASATNKFLTQSSSGAPAWNTIVPGDLPGSFSGFANPTASIGLTAVNGSATTAMRSDGAPALDVGISPTWTGSHTFSNTITAAAANFSGTVTVGTNIVASVSGTTSLISTGTADASDNWLLSITGGGAAAGTRGGFINIAGNEHANTGTIAVTAGNVTGGVVRLVTGGSIRVTVSDTGPVTFGTSSPLTLSSVTDSTTTATGALIVSGGVGIAKAVFIGTTLNVAGAVTGSTFNGLTLTSVAVGFTVAGGTTSKTLTVPLDATVSGTNSGDQTITLTGDVTGSGTGSFAATIGANKVTLAKMDTLAANSIIGNNTGSAATPLALSTSQVKSLLSLNLVENTALSTWAGTANITTLGTITTGTWTGTTIAVLNGGTGVTTSTGSGSNVLGTSPTFTTSILYTTTDMLLVADTSDGSDSKRLIIGGGGAGTASRGGSIIVAGNEHSGTGEVRFTAGDVAGGVIGLVMRDNQAGAFVLRENANNYISVDTTNAAELITLIKAVSMSSTLAVTGAITGGDADFTGNVGILSANTNAARAFRIAGTGLSGDNQIGMLVSPTWSSASVTTATVADLQFVTAAGAFTVVNGYCLHIEAPSLGAGSAVTTNYALKIEDQGASQFSIATGTGKISFGDSVSISGTVRTGGTAVSTIAVDIINSGLTGTAQYGLAAEPIFNSSATASGVAAYADLRTAASSFTMVKGIGLQIDSPSIGSGSSVTTLYGLKIENQSGGGTNFAIATGTGQVSIGDDLKLATVGKGLYIKEGSNATMGTATLVLGVATVSTTKVTASSRIFLSVESLGTIASPVAVSVTARSAGTSFTITSANLTDTSVIAWVILEPA